MGAEDVVHAVDSKEFLDHLRSKGVSCAAWRKRELVPVAVGIAPHEVGHGTFVRDLAKPINDLDLVDAMDAGA